MNLKVVLIDDEEKSRIILKQLIEEFIPDVSVVAMAADVLEGIKMIQHFQPDVVFLDIEMPGYSGFKLLEYFEPAPASDNKGSISGRKPKFEIVITSAYEKYAIKAYKTNAIGYLLKPIDIDDLTKVFEKLLEERKKKVGINHSLSDDNSHRIIFPTQSGMIYLDSDEICYLESSGRYTDIFLYNNEKMTTTLSLKDCCEKLANATFIRIHRSAIINLFYIQNYSKGRDSFVILDNDKKIDVGHFYKEDLNKAVSSFLK